MWGERVDSSQRWQTTPLADDPLADDPLADDPLADDPLADDPLADDPLADDPLADDPLADDPLADDPLADDPLADDPLADDPLADDPLADDPLADDPLADDPLADDPLADDPSVPEWVTGSGLDFTLISEDGTCFPCNQGILATRCLLLRDLAAYEPKTNEAKLPFTADEIRKFLQWFHTDGVVGGFYCGDGNRREGIGAYLSVNREQTELPRPERHAFPLHVFSFEGGGPRAHALHDLASSSGRAKSPRDGRLLHCQYLLHYQLPYPDREAERFHRGRTSG